MFKLIKFVIVLCLIIVAGYLLLGVSFGQKTLYQHLLNISKTEAAQTLKTEIGKKMDHATKDIGTKAKKFAIDGVKERLKTVKESKKADETETVSKTDKEKLQSLIQKKEQAASRQIDRTSLDQLIHKKNQESH